eukprot:CAMPEP_0174294956 /NCGR_PEP_ID=MMETSP0809-20121228/43182_1 /TAXON_ID=73025 ORGANISM="Eutreptiella gymnastica-like, Strain CCMP1594" /NCGR_SAMPLE_ID=MMETSP0809 /ASSEMBLY_ACC=CAM_ASM_000658 /LENGTH=162 /DNA_ID=CAMNT_0015396813 /DNA_START=1 /DNA_END=486 /DNA_ORIENTATION=+
MGGMGGMGGMPGGMGGFGGMGGMPFGMMGGMGGMPGMRGSSTRRRKPERPDQISSGTKVVLCGLQSAAQHNGKVASVVDYDAGAGRYTVQLNDGTNLALKPTNLTQIVNAQIYGLKSQPELNGASGKVVRWDEDKGRYEVNVPSHNKSLSLQPANVVLPTGV